MKSTASADPKVAEMFNRISSTYDFLNRLLSMGVDRRWRSGAIRALKLRPGAVILDCSAGTGDMALRALRDQSSVIAVLLDPAREMLRLAVRKVAKLQPANFFCFQGAAESLPFQDNRFDHFMVAFGIRNFADLKKGTSELYRVLKPGGCGVILEFTPDRSAVINRIFRAYMWTIMRPLGGLVSRDRNAYAYLARTVENFPVTDLLVKQFAQAGFRDVSAIPLSLGIATRFLLYK